MTLYGNVVVAVLVSEIWFLNFCFKCVPLAQKSRSRNVFTYLLLTYYPVHHPVHVFQGCDLIFGNNA